MAYQHYRSPFGDTTYTKVFVGGLAWETPTDVMRLYFEQFGEILEAVIITDKNTGKSKGYGFVTFRDSDSATRACTDPNPMIDGRRANCNIASLGRPRPPPPRVNAGRNQGGGYQGGVAAQGGGLPLPLPPPSAAAAAPTPPVMYQPYGYATYPPEYVYPQAYYNPQFQQAQYYGQIYGGGGGGGVGTSTANMGLGSPYFYGYSMQANARGAAAYSAVVPQAQRIQAPSYLYYPTHQVEGGSSFPTFSPTSYQTPSHHLLPFQPTRNAVLSPPASDSPAATHHTTAEAEATVPSENANA